MNLTVLGGTGGVGSQVVDQLRSRGHRVTAHVRNPDKVPAGWGDDVTVVVGELSDAAAVDRAVQGADAVVRAYDELVGMSDIVMTSGLDWTIVCFLAPKDGSAKGRSRQGFSGSDTLGFNVTRAEIAQFTAAQVDDDRYIGAAPAISN